MLETLAAPAGAGSLVASLRADEELIRAAMFRQLATIAELDRSGFFAERGYRSAASAVGDLLGWDPGEARRRVAVAEQVCGRTTLDGQEVAPVLPATAMVLAEGRASVRHAEVISEALGSAAARRLAPEAWARVEEQLAAEAPSYRPAELAGLARQLIDLLDQDGPEPEQPEPVQVNELHLSPRTGQVKGRLDAVTFEALATALDAYGAPRDGEDRRPVVERNAAALGEVCRQVLDGGLGRDAGGSRPQLVVTVPLAELESRARRAVLDVGGGLTPSEVRLLACDARVVPVVLGGAGQPVDVGRAMRTVPDGMRRAVHARDRGCAFLGCDRRPSWTEVHHIHEWQHGGPTAVHNLVALCRLHHGQVHRSDWVVRMRDGIPEFVPPKWIDPSRTPRTRPRLRL